MTEEIEETLTVKETEETLEIEEEETLEIEEPEIDIEEMTETEETIEEMTEIDTEEMIIEREDPMINLDKDLLHVSIVVKKVTSLETVKNPLKEIT